MPCPPQYHAILSRVLRNFRSACQLSAAWLGGNSVSVVAWMMNVGASISSRSDAGPRDSKNSCVAFDQVPLAELSASARWRAKS